MFPYRVKHLAVLFYVPFSEHIQDMKKPSVTSPSQSILEKKISLDWGLWGGSFGGNLVEEQG